VGAIVAGVDRVDSAAEPLATSGIDFAAALLEQNRLLAELIHGADPATPVPGCPGWTLTQLLRHVGRGDRWAATIVRERRDSFLDPKDVSNGKPPDDPDGAVEWLRESARTLVDAVARVGADTTCWTFLGPRPAAFWVRRRLHETTVHRADAALAVGVEYELAPVLAADGLAEWLDIVSATSGRGDRPAPLDRGASLHLHATDGALGPAGEWLVEAADGGVSWRRGHAKATTAVRGPVVNLLLATLRRRPEADGLELIGDADVWTRWLARTPF
jgi:uncharacterized protein (TIGR03083 family)